MSEKPKFTEQLEDIFTEAMQERGRAAFHLQGREERKARLEAVMALSSELLRIRAVNIFATGIGESVIVDIIEGDWPAAKRIAAHFTFEDESAEVRATYAPLWAEFVRLAHDFCTEAERRALKPLDAGDQLH